MTGRPSFRAALREADAALRARSRDRASAERVRRRLRGPVAAPPRARRVPVLIAGLAGLAAGAALLFALSRAPTPAPSTPAIAGLRIENATADLRYALATDGTLTIEAGACHLVDEADGIRAIAGAPAMLRDTADGVRVVRGTVTFEVARREPGRRPVRIAVSHGAIEVLGTRFVVEQRRAGGRVTLHEGAIRFVDRGGTSTELAVGASLTWPARAVPAKPPAPVPPPPAPAPRDKEPRPHRTPPAPPVPAPADEAKPGADEADAGAGPTAAGLRAELARLRSRGQFARAATLLRGAITDPRLEAVAREQLSYELGAILTHQLDDAASACGHWRWHAEAFRGERYAVEVARAVAALGCATR